MRRRSFTIDDDRRPIRKYLALGYLLTRNMLKYDDVVTEVEYDDDLQWWWCRTEHHTTLKQN